MEWNTGRRTDAAGVVVGEINAMLTSMQKYEREQGTKMGSFYPRNKREILSVTCGSGKDK